MNWFKENKFVAGLLGVTVVGAGVLGYLLITAKAKYEQASTDFDTQAAELSKLERLPAYPDQRNLKQLEEQRQAHVTLIQEVQKELATSQLPLETLSPNAFQDRLRTAVTEFEKEADKFKIARPKGFYMGFEPYASTPPTPAAAGPLGRQLKAVQLVLAEVLKNGTGIREIKAFEREPFAEETNLPRGAGSSPAAPAATPKPAGKGPAGRPEAPPPFTKTHIDLAFFGDQTAVRSVLNGLSQNRTQFFIARFVGVENEKQAGPPREPKEGATPVENASRVIVGQEKVQATLRIEIVNVAEPAIEQPKPGARGARTPSNQ